MSKVQRLIVMANLILLVLVYAVTSSAQDEPYAPMIDPANFVAGVDNPYFPLVPGTTMVYEGDVEDGRERIEVSVYHETKEILGVTTTVVRDSVWLNGELIEDTFDWYAQDADGNVWYFGEDTHEYENGVPINSHGAWEAGVDGAQPGIVMQAAPQVGDLYRQEFYAGVAEDMAEVLSVTDSATVAFGTFENMLTTRDWTPLEPDAEENKSYAAGVGLVLEVMTKGGTGRIELVDIVTWGPGGEAETNANGAEDTDSAEDTDVDDAEDADEAGDVDTTDGDEATETEDDEAAGMTSANGTPLISAEQAIQAAQALASGTVGEVELEFENDRWVYEVEIGTAEVAIDAINGQVLSNNS